MTWKDVSLRMSGKSSVGALSECYHLPCEELFFLFSVSIGNLAEVDIYPSGQHCDRSPHHAVGIVSPEIIRGIQMVDLPNSFVGLSQWLHLELVKQLEDAWSIAYLTHNVDVPQASCSNSKEENGSI